MDNQKDALDMVVCLSRQAVDARDATDAMKYAQAAVSVAQALQLVYFTPPRAA